MRGRPETRATRGGNKARAGEVDPQETPEGRRLAINRDSSKRRWIELGSLAYVIGVMLGDGGVYGKSYTVFCRDKNRSFVEAVAGMAGKIFGVEPHLRRASPNCWMASTNHGEVHRVLVKLGYPKGRKLTNLSIPPRFVEDPEDRVEVLKGLFDAEGYCGLDVQRHGEKIYEYPYVGIDMIARPLIKQVQRILEDLGIESSVSIKKPRARGRNPQLSLVIKGTERVRKFANLIGFKHPEKSEKLRRLVEGESSETIRQAPREAG